MKKIFMAFGISIGWHFGKWATFCIVDIIEKITHSFVRELRTRDDTPKILKTILGNSKETRNKHKIKMGFQG